MDRKTVEIESLEPKKSKTMNPELMLVMPVYNEQECIRKVVSEWFDEIEKWTENFVILVIDDGSTDNTLTLLQRLQSQLGSRLEVISRENRGHGQSCIQGYKLACERTIPFVMQIDSDGQCDTSYFHKLWRKRNTFPVIYGDRVKRDDGWRRVLASWILRFTVFFSTGAWCTDPNVPYRLMQTVHLSPVIESIPNDIFLANVALAVLLRKVPDLRHERIPIRFRERYAGEPSVRLNQFGNRAVELVRQLRNMMQ